MTPESGAADDRSIPRTPRPSGRGHGHLRSASSSSLTASISSAASRACRPRRMRPRVGAARSRASMGWRARARWASSAVPAADEPSRDRRGLDDPANPPRRPPTDEPQDGQSRPRHRKRRDGFLLGDASLGRRSPSHDTEWEFALASDFLAFGGGRLRRHGPVLRTTSCASLWDGVGRCQKGPWGCPLGTSGVGTGWAGTRR